MGSLRLAVMALLLAVPLLIRAHEGGAHASGVVSAVGDDELTITTHDGDKKTFVLTKDTTFVRDGAPASKGDLKVGARAVVHARQVGARLEATSVRFASAAPKRE